MNVGDAFTSERRDLEDPETGRLRAIQVCWARGGAAGARRRGGQPGAGHDSTAGPGL